MSEPSHLQHLARHNLAKDPKTQTNNCIYPCQYSLPLSSFRIACHQQQCKQGIHVWPWAEALTTKEACSLETGSWPSQLTIPHLAALQGGL